MQEDIIDSVLTGNDTLALLPTGGGKSLCYQVPAMLQKGLCLVISPLVALMQDQVARLNRQGIPATTVYAGMKWTEVRKTLDAVLDGQYKFLYLSPERLQSDQFQEYLPALDIDLIAIDEAHCISQWGHDFRPEYLQIAEIRKLYPKTPFLALTASATEGVQQDIVKQLKLRQAAIFRQSFDRPNIDYNIRYSENKVQHILEAIFDREGSTIIYCRSRKQTELLSRELQQNGVTALSYHAGMSRVKREEAQNSWMLNETRVMVATTAFGMGIDKADVRLVMHYDAPEQLEAYYQEAGRAGRDGHAATAITFYNHTDILRLKESTALQYPPAEYLRHIYQSVNEFLQIPIGDEPNQYFPFEITEFAKRFKLDAYPASYALKLLAREGLWTISDAVFLPATVQFTADRHTLDNIAERYPEMGAVTTALLRLYNGIYQFPVVVRIITVAKKLKAQKEDVVRVLHQLDEMGVLEYKTATDGPQLFFHHYRVDSRHLNINMQRIVALRNQHEYRTEAMVHFMQNRKVCRSLMMLHYFGEALKDDCGHCDYCHWKEAVRTWDIGKIKPIVLTFLATKGTVAVQQLTSRFPAGNQEQLLTLVRAMMDDGLVTWHKDNTLTLNKRS